LLEVLHYCNYGLLLLFAGMCILLEWHVHEAVEALTKGVQALYGYGIAGHLAEFGTCTGSTAKGLAAAIAKCEKWRPSELRRLYLYDSFEGFPHADNEIDRRTPHIVDGIWGPGVARGLTAEQLRNAVERHLPAEQIAIIPGWYKDTVPASTKSIAAQGATFSLVHVDCDFYASTMIVLDALLSNKALTPGAFIYFDDWSCNHASPEFGERRAWAEAVEKYSIKWSDQMAYGLFARCLTVHSYAERR
jgi:hypothetical protein